jgi:hypothetical protein
MALGAVLASRHPGERRDPALLTSAAVPRQIKMDSSCRWNDEWEMGAVLPFRHSADEGQWARSSLFVIPANAGIRLY